MELTAVVVVPAHNEEATIGGCLAALAAQDVGPNAFEVVVVLDACSDQTEAVVRDAARALALTVHLLRGPGTGAGAARRLGMDAAAARLRQLSGDGLIASTDADSRPESDWLRRQLEHSRAGAKAIAGLVTLDAAEAAQLPPGVLTRRADAAAVRLAEVRKLAPAAEHHHFAGASLAVTASTYASVGGLEPLPALEDARFAERLQEHGVEILRPADVHVRTSARTDGRARRGLAVDIALASWAERRRFSACQFPIDRLVADKGTTTVTVVVPTKQCAGTIAGVLADTVAPLRAAGLVDELVVVDAGSADGTAGVARQAGAHVLDQDELLQDFGPALGKGDAMWRATSATSGDLVAFLDGDTANPHPDHLAGLLGPLLSDPAISLVKGAFSRPFRTAAGEFPGEGGRVTELMARPLLNVHEPLLAGFEQPLAGEFAARRGLLESVPFPVGYGIEIALLIDALRAVGLDGLAESQLGTRINRHQPLLALGEMAYAVLAAVERRIDGHAGLADGTFVRPGGGLHPTRIPVQERPPLASLTGPEAVPGRCHRRR